MRIALLLSGFIRSFNYNNISKYILENNNVDIFMHISKNEYELDKYYNIKYSLEYIKNKLKPTIIIVENEQSNINNKYNNTLSKWYKIHKLYQEMIEYENKNNINYDIILVYRPDIFLYNKIDFSLCLNSNYIYIPKKNTVETKELIDNNYICDILAYGLAKYMKKYIDLYNKINIYEKDVDIVSENLLYYHLNTNNIKYKNIDIDYKIILSNVNVIAICGDSGAGKTTIMKLLEPIFNNCLKFECDRYHKWERGNNNWKKYTHLNPDANFLCKMRDDIFDLKVGDNVYQVDYDHNTGKFTEKNKIEPKENIIICGLHTLYDNIINKIINLKIYVDTEKDIKIDWKLKRDTTKRNQNKETILNSINNRINDYKHYIEPQKDNANIIIRYFTDNKLKLNITTEYNLTKFTKYLDILNYDYTININYNNIIFNNNNVDTIKLYKLITNNIGNIEKGYDGIIQCIVSFIIINNFN